MIFRNVLLLIAVMISSSAFSLSIADMNEAAPLNCKNGFDYEIEDDSVTVNFEGYINVNDPTTYSWDFGDGSTGTGEIVSHTYSPVGTQLFEICLSSESIDTNGDTCIDVSCQSIWVGTSTACVAYFVGNASPTNPMTWQFTDFSSGNPDNWAWDFGDGTTSTLQSPLHTYPNAGVYNVCMTITDNTGACNDTYCLEIIVEGLAGECISDFTYSSPDLFNFEFIAFMEDTTLQPFQYDWNFGDGNFGSGQITNHTFEVGPPFYNVCLTTSTTMPGGDTCKYDVCYDVYIGSAPDCQALHSWEYTGQPLEVQFLDESFGDPTSWYWDFGDSTYSTEQNPVHTYPREDTYEVCQTITNETNGCTSTLCTDVYIGNIPPPAGCDNEIQHTVDTSGYIYSFHGEAFSEGVNISDVSLFQWDFDDGNTATGQDVVHTFTEVGAYIVELKTVSYLSVFDTCIAYNYLTVVIGDPDFCIGGYVYLSDGTTAADAGEVHLISYDTATNILVLIESMPIEAGGYYLFENLEIDDPFVYYVQAGLSSSSAHYGQYVPTYHEDAIHWENAWLAMLHVCPPTTYHNIVMHESTAATSGSGNIYGTVYNGDTKDIIADIEILLLNENHLPLKYVYTDDNGAFGFGSLAFGTYYILPEKVGIETEGFMVTLNEETPNHPMSIIVGNGVAELSVAENSILAIAGELFPNPAKSQLNFRVSAEHTVVAEMSVYNHLGQKMLSQNQRLSKGMNDIGLNISNLPESIYYLSLQVDESKPLMRKFIKID